ncbi:rod shape-determining protein [Candidatus Dojkabacteria bacterium]|uniref:Cell shape-determining protein MreB n=1 Tax=Candidatus Dojkabacteria bacterium TaxID=2099670 RepID=A0A955KZV4_9BACT|nr:rod shape-determining protein [Candidatus Dojkabacteria bacterium]
MFATPKLAIDLGTANTVILMPGKGVVLQEPTVAAVSRQQRKIVAVGAEAKEMLGKVPEGLEARRPMQSGAIANYLIAEAMLKKFLGKVLPGMRLMKPEVVASVPAGITSVEERAVIQALESAGAGKIYLLPEPIAAAIGAGLPISAPAGNMIVNMGGGTAEIAVVSLNGIVSHTSKRGAGDALTQAITDEVKRQHKLLIGEQMAEKVKHQIGSVMEMGAPLTMEIRGRGTKSGMPETVLLSSNDFVDALRGVLQEVVVAAKQVLSETPPELAADIADRGIVLSGGTALLRNVDQFFTKSIGVPAYVVDDPLLCVVKGLEIALQNLGEFGIKV